MTKAQLVAHAACLVAIGAWASAQGAPAAATYTARGTINNCGKQIPIASASEFRISCQVRTGQNDVEVHAKEIDIFVIVDGTATLVTGGTLVNPDTTNPLQIKAKGIEGGETRQLVQGDVVVIPAGVPHWFKTIPSSINFLSTKVFKP